MSAPTATYDYQIVRGPDGQPLYYLVPVDEMEALRGRADDHITLPHEVVGAHTIEGKSLIRAWREHLGLTQNDLADKLGISQSALSQMEAPDSKPQRATLEKVAAALGIQTDQLTD